MILDAEQRGELNPGGTIIEATSRNTDNENVDDLVKDVEVALE